ncbi:MAG: isoprenylcysteine carboxylmethyltransferase family protein [Planctomycetes bacterium]|nr:isoprenylcysteine carboxylmethyltransferase family protein [Planctomycetota bacterium]
MAARLSIFAYGLVAYSAAMGALLYAIGFVGNVVVPKSIDSGEVGSVGTAILINVLILAAFAVQHTIMARPGFKARWTKIVPVAIERSTFVLLASAILILLFWQWRPIPAVVWRFEPEWARAIVYGVSFFGWFVVFYSSFLIDHFDLFGLRQVVLQLRGKEYTHPVFRTVGAYHLVRHPLMLGLLIAFWFAPTMTYGHLLFAAVTTGYILIGIQLEERDLRAALGEEYAHYRSTTPMLLPVQWKRYPGREHVSGPT